MKKFLVILLAVALLAINVATNNGKRVLAIHPVAFMSAVKEDLPPGLDIFQNFVSFYNEGDNDTLGDKILWLGKTVFDSISFPVTGTIWLFRACIAFWSNFGELFEFSYGSGDGEHGDISDPNYAGGR